jgi:MFS family permease
VIISFVSKVLLGIGSGMNSTSVISIITSVYYEEKERFLGYVESSCGVGLLLGPILGTILYSVGGYILPFAILGLAYFIMWPLITLVL